MCAIRNNPDQTPLVVAILARQNASFYMLVTLSNPFVRDQRGNTLLHLVAEVEFKVGFGPLSCIWARGDSRNKKGKTGAITAARSNAHRFLRRASKWTRVHKS